MKLKICLLLLFFQGVLLACDVPVFRYALERWERDLYKVFILHRGELNDNDKALAEQIKKNTIVEGGHTNLVSFSIDLDEAKAAGNFYDAYKGLKSISITNSPKMVLLFPNRTRVNAPIWQGNLNQENVNELLNSKATAELMKGVLQGYSSTFLLLESGDKKKDERAVLEINQAIEKLKKELSIPEGVVQTDGSVTGNKLTAYEAASIDPSNVLRSGIPLKIDFHLVRMPQNESNPIFRAILAKTFKSDAAEKEPRLFAFFGRGRLLGPMIGEEIIQEHVMQLSQYICGACSCQVKRGNPGVDFLTNLDWYSYLAGSEVVIDKELPPLIGLIDITTSVQTDTTENTVEHVTDIKETVSSPILRNTIYSVAGLFIFILGGTLIMRKK